MSIISFLSLLSERVERPALQRRVVIEAFPNVMVLEAVALTPTELYPIKVLFSPVVLAFPAWYPMAVLYLPVLS